MRSRSAAKSVAQHSVELDQAQAYRQKTSGFLPFYLVESLGIFCDFVLIVSASVLSGIGYHFLFLGWFGPVDSFFAVGTLTYVIFSAILAARGAYRPQNIAYFRKQAWLTSAVWLFVFFVFSAVAFSLKTTETYSRGATLTFFVVGWTVIIVWRLMLSRYISRALAEGRFAERKILLLAERAQLETSSVVNDLKRCGYLPVRTFDFVSDAVDNRWIMPAMDEIISATRQASIECVFLLVPWDYRARSEELMEKLHVLALPVYLLPDNNVAHFLGNRMVSFGTSWTAELKRAPLSRIERAFKRVLDILVASVVLIPLAPMMILLAVVIKIDSRGPIFFVQKRNGFNGRPFRILKFRTMSVLEDGPIIHQAKRDDPRITRFGHLLRRTNIDELPQLLNVIAGDMSLVGPRPHASAHNSEYEETVANYAYRYHVKPGLTGWAQINGFRGETRNLELMAKRVEYDLWYINNWSIWLDLRILLRTLVVGLQPTAY
jgi:Undecaprenyl-phosphate glucose phosphotransferase